MDLPRIDAPWPYVFGFMLPGLALVVVGILEGVGLLKVSRTRWLFRHEGRCVVVGMGTFFAGMFLAYVIFGPKPM